MAGHSLYIKPIIGPVNFKLPGKYEYQYRLDDEYDDEYVYSDDDEGVLDIELMFYEITKCAPNTTFLAKFYSYSSKTMSHFTCNYIFNSNGSYELISEEDLSNYKKDDLIIDNPEDGGMLGYLHGELTKPIEKINQIVSILGSYLERDE